MGWIGGLFALFAFVTWAIGRGMPALGMVKIPVTKKQWAFLQSRRFMGDKVAIGVLHEVAPPVRWWNPRVIFLFYGRENLYKLALSTRLAQPHQGYTDHWKDDLDAWEGFYKW